MSQTKRQKQEAALRKLKKELALMRSDNQTYRKNMIVTQIRNLERKGIA